MLRRIGATALRGRRPSNFARPSTVLYQHGSRWRKLTLLDWKPAGRNSKETQYALLILLLPAMVMIKKKYWFGEDWEDKMTLERALTSFLPWHLSHHVMDGGRKNRRN